MVATRRLYVTVSYGSCVVASDLYSTVSNGGAVQTPGAMCTCRGCTISQQNRVVRTSAFGCLNWAGSISFVRTFFFFLFFFWLPLGFSDFFFFFFVDVGNRTNVFFVQKHILAKLARFARGVLIHATDISKESILWFAWACLHVRVKGGRRRRAAG